MLYFSSCKNKRKLNWKYIAFLLFQIATVQGLSGTGSLRLAAALIERYFPGSKVLISSPTWGAFYYSLKSAFRMCFLGSEGTDVDC